MFIGLLIACTAGSFDGSLASNSKGHIKIASLNNQPCQAGTTLFDINSNELFFIHLLSVLLSVGEVVILLMINMLEYVFQIK